MAILCFLTAEKLGLGKLAKLMGLLHDFGKGTADFQNYLRGAGSRHHNHAGLGALYVHRHWWQREAAKERRQTAQLISLCIYGHHAGLPDCFGKIALFRRPAGTAGELLHRSNGKFLHGSGIRRETGQVV